MTVARGRRWQEYCDGGKLVFRVGTGVALPALRLGHLLHFVDPATNSLTQATQVLTPKTAFLVHFVMVMTIAAATAVSWVLRDVVSVAMSLLVVRILRYAALSELLVVGLIILRLRSTIPLLASDGDPAVWWATYGGRVLVTWALAYGVGVTGAVLWLVTRDMVILFAVAFAAIVLLMRLSPQRWRDDEPPYRSKLAP